MAGSSEFAAHLAAVSSQPNAADECAADAIATVSDVSAEEIHFCSGNQGKFEQIRLQLMGWLERERLRKAALRPATDETSNNDPLQFSADDPDALTIHNAFSGKILKILRRPDIAEQLDPEPQFDSIQKIAEYKARKAFELLGRERSVLVQDSGLVCEALSDFPGPYTKYVTETIGAKGILKLMEGVENRKCGFDGCMVYVDGRTGGMSSFTEPYKYFGRVAIWEETVFGKAEDDDDKMLSGKPENKVQPNADCVAAAGEAHNDSIMHSKNGSGPVVPTAALQWAGSSPNRNLFSIFVPDATGGKKTLLALEEEELRAYRKARKSCFQSFVVEVVGSKVWNGSS